MTRVSSIQVAIIVVASAILLASTQTLRPEGWSLAGQYSYWLTRICLEAGLFLAFAELFARQTGLAARPLFTSTLAAVVSLVPFVLAVTALDLVLGLPELDGKLGFGASGPTTPGGASSNEMQFGSLMREIIYLSDNHLALCLLLSVPRILVPASLRHSASPAAPESQEEMRVHSLEQNGAEAHQPSAAKKEQVVAGFQRHLDRPIETQLLRIEAQEHYVRLVGKEESQMLLYRFNDIVSEIADDLGMQVHRSHWVAFDAIESLAQADGRLWLNLRDGSKVPVSRKYAPLVRNRISRLLHERKKAAE